MKKDKIRSIRINSEIEKYINENLGLTVQEFLDQAIKDKIDVKITLKNKKK